MGNNKQPQTITLDDQTYDVETLTNEQRGVLAHIEDLERKHASCMFQADQLRVGRDAFVAMLRQSLAVGRAQPISADQTTVPDEPNKGA